MTYKEKIEELVNDCNLVLSDRIFLPTPTGKLELTFQDAMIKEGDQDVDCMICNLSFIDKDKKHTIMNYSSSVGPDEYFYRQCYFRIFRALFLTIDFVPKPENINGNEQMSFLNFRTLAFEGLKQLNK